jgi:Flp pilus assembly protein TadG
MLRKSGSGQGLVEFSLLLPILLFLIIGTISLGQLFHIKVILENAAREGALFMVYNREEGRLNSFALSKAAVQQESENAGVEILNTDIDIYCEVGAAVNNNCPEGSMVVVTVHHDISIVFDTLFGGPFTLSNDARMLIP